VSDSHPKDDGLLGDTLPPTRTDPELPRTTEPGLAATHHSGEHPQPSVPGRALSKGDTVDRYVVLERLGAGGMGEVLAAWDPALDRKVALKLLKAEHQNSAIADELRLRLMREAQALARMTHPNVVTVHDVGIVEGQVYLAMEFVEGQTLTKWLTEKPRTWREILEIFLDAGEGLAAAHEAGVTHRDFKPDNVVVSRHGRARVMDFGLAYEHGQRAAEAETPLPTAETPTGSMRRRITLPGIMLGTPAYMSPEALYGKPTDPRSDAFSFAIALFEALYGVRPFEGETAPAVAAEMQLNRVRPPPRKTQVPRRIHELLLKALRANPDERFQTLRALLVQLGRRKSSRRRQVVTVAVAVLATLSLVVVAALARREAQRCAGFGQRLAGMWDEGTRDEAKRAFLASGRPWASTAWSETERLMDGWGRRWVDRRREACEAADGQADEQVGQRIVCLSRRLADFDATARVLRTADGEVVERAVSLAAALPDLQSCERTEGLPVAAQEQGSARAELAGVKALLEAGKVKEARGLSERLLDNSGATEASGVLAEATWLSARLSAAELDYAKADQLAEDAILLAQQHGDDELLARAWVDRVGFAAFGQGALTDAERWARYARVAVTRCGAPRELEASLANNEAVLRNRQGRTAEALSLHQKALALREAVSGPRSPLAARSHNNVGIALRALGRAGDAVTSFRAALEIEEAVLAADHPAVADTLNNLANALNDDGKTTEAIAALERSLRIRESAFGPDSPKVAQSLSNLGAVYLDQHRPADALPLLTRALAIKEQSAGKDSPTVAVTLTNLATAQRQAGRFDDALASDSRALVIRRTRHGSQSPESARNLVGLGETHLALGNVSAARPLLEQAYALSATASTERGDAAFRLAELVRKADPTRARALIREALAAWPPGYPSRVEANALLEPLPALRK
jgi:tetratricopeptide (TPR) repeat protein/tRNA A-37 threonylcarbamoyl transferase component Bud32